MTPQLTSLTISDFRSIRGSVTIPLDAPVVLIHGQNGAGKTSILSALEMALTGHVPSLARLDANYRSQLVHKGATQAHIALTSLGLKGLGGKVRLTIQEHGTIGEPLLPAHAAQFYSERSYLAQSTLARLLEIYQHKERKSDSPLTEFVKDLLGLDQLDALIDGLYDAGDVRRLRTTVPAYWMVREGIPPAETSLRALNASLVELETQVGDAEARVLVKIRALELNPSLLGRPAPELLSLFQEHPEEEQLQRFARLRRDLLAAHELWLTIAAATDSSERAAVEGEEIRARHAVDVWRSGSGKMVAELLGSLAVFFPGLPLPMATSPEQAHSAAVRAVAADLQRCASLVEQDATDAKRIAALDQDLERARSRAAVLDQQIVGLAAGAESLARALAGITPHLHSEECPVCGRDFHQVSKTPLQAHVSERIAALTQGAGKLQALSLERAEAVRILSAAERERGLIASRQLAATVRDETKTRRARLEELRGNLASFAHTVTEGEQLISLAAVHARRLDALRARDQAATSLRETVATLAGELGEPSLGSAGSLGDALDRLKSRVLEKEELLTGRQALRHTVTADVRDLQKLREVREKLKAAIRKLEADLARLCEAKNAADGRLSQARELMRKAREARSVIVRRVFNDSLNKVWRDLFVRLAPEEPFVPAFAIPEAPGGAIEATLETLYRAGGKGGDPRAMLSAGNLNTAALTLFLALHLSVEPLLPWLVIDDPFQSMDEVHIAQFSALLRTLSKQHGRQIVIAVHERPLFEYLALELSPAFPDDRLITIELGRTPNGTTVMKYEPLIWRPDPAIGVAIAG